MPCVPAHLWLAGHVVNVDRHSFEDYAMFQSYMEGKAVAQETYKVHVHH